MGDLDEAIELVRFNLDGSQRNWNGRECLLMSRATDETGYVQPSLDALRKARGIGTHYHFNNIRAGG